MLGGCRYLTIGIGNRLFLPIGSPLVSSIAKLNWESSTAKSMPMATMTMVSTSTSANVSDGQSTTNIVDDVVQAFEGRIGGLIANAIDTRLSKGWRLKKWTQFIGHCEVVIAYKHTVALLEY